MPKPIQLLTHRAALFDLNRNPTTSFLTATTSIYAIGAGVTAAAGIRLALQLILVSGFIIYAFP